MNVIPYLHFSGQCEEAFNLYATVLGGKASFFRYAGSPMEKMAPDGWGGKVMHASLEFAGHRLYGSDVTPPYFQTPQGFGVCIEAADVAEGERIYNGLSEGGKIKMPYQETFWAHRYGDFTDRFGISWIVNVPKPM
jgi:PhnB protein